jgi:hypothetical protein
VPAREVIREPTPLRIPDTTACLRQPQIRCRLPPTPSSAVLAEAWPDPEVVQGTIAQLPWRQQIVLMEKLGTSKAKTRRTLSRRLTRSF